MPMGCDPWRYRAINGNMTSIPALAKASGLSRDATISRIDSLDGEGDAHKTSSLRSEAQFSQSF